MFATALPRLSVHAARVARTSTAALSAALLALNACSEGQTSATGPGASAPVVLNQTVTSSAINASSNDTLTYFSLATNSTVKSTGDWDIALRRFEIRLNGGVSGGKGVVGYSVDNNKAATDAQVLAFTADNTLTAYNLVTIATLPAANLFFADHLIENKDAYLNLNGIPSANAAAYWKVKTATGGYALTHITAIAFTQTFSLASITIETRVQAGAALGAPVTTTIPLGANAASISLATNAVVAANGCNWDLQINPQTFDMIANSACNAGTYPGSASPLFTAATSASDAPQYAAFLSELTSPIPNSVTDGSAPFRYNLTGNNRLSPDFNIYIIKSGTAIYKMQVINYYDAGGNSGYPTLRFTKIQ